MDILPRVISVKAIADFQLDITFTDGDVGVFDCRPLLTFGVFQELADEAYFRQVRVFNGTVTWPHEQDICPDTLYLDSRRAATSAAATATPPAHAGGKRP
jgi:hypothetical protein